MRFAPFRNLPIKWKVISIALMTTFLALVLALATLVTEGYITLRRNLIQDTKILAQVIGMNSASALLFQDTESAVQTLSGLRVKRDIAAAYLFSPSGTLFAQYRRANDAPSLPPALPTQGAFFDSEGLKVSEPIIVEGKVVGLVYLESDVSVIHESMYRVLIMSLAAILIALGVAFVMSSILHRFISAPLESLARTAHRVSAEKNYSLRVAPWGKDEVGELVSGFNDMLNEIQSRDEALKLTNTELKKYANDLERSNTELDDFAYIASHDLKEPLRGIHNYSNFLLEDYADKIDDEGKAKLHTLLRLTKRLENLIEALLQYSRIGRLDLAIKETDLQQLVTDILDTLHIFLEKENVTATISKELPTLVCDASRVGEIFHNLITNGVKYNEKPDKRIEIGWELARDLGVDSVDPDLYVFYVRDNGIGIQEKYFQSIFRIFKRLHGKEKFGGGTGAGLTIVKKIVERHGGVVWVNSVFGEGTTFYFTLQPNQILPPPL